MDPEETGVQETTPVSDVPEGAPPEGDGAQVSERNDSSDSQAEAFKSMRERIDRLEQENRFFKEAAQRGPQPVEQQTEQQRFQDDDYLTYGDLNKVIDERVSKITEGQRVSRRVEQEQSAREKYPDWEETVKAVGQRINERQYKILMEADNPAEAFYQAKSLFPDLVKDKLNRATQDATSQIQKNLNRTPTLAQAGGATSVTDEITKIKNMTDEEFKKTYWKDL